MAAISVEQILGKGHVKRKARDEHSAEDPKRSRNDETAEALLEALDQIEEAEILDESGTKKLVAKFQKANSHNQEMRVKHPDDAPKFMESELDLHQAIQELHAIASMPQFYNSLVETQTAEQVIQLLDHQNTDIAIAVITLLQELTDVDTIIEAGYDGDSLIEILVNGKVVVLIVKCIDKLDEKQQDEADGVHNGLGLIENLTELRPLICDQAYYDGLLPWLLKRLKTKNFPVFDGNKLYASEILAIVLQLSESSQRLIGELDGIDVLLQQLAAYKRNNPQSADEIEYMENLFSCLCASLLSHPNRGKFLKGEGLQLMNLMLREKKMSRNSALKVLDYATSGAQGKENCDKLVEILGLRTLFPLFMKTPDRHKRQGTTASEMEEHVCSIIGSLLKWCGTTQKLRVLAKFQEQNYAKLERLVELHLQYYRRVKKFEHKKETSNDDLDDDEKMAEKLDAGLFTLQTVDYVLAEVCLSTSSIKHHTEKLIKIKGGSFKQLKDVLISYRSSMESEKLDTPEDKAVQERILYLIDNL